jgi:hypothetical protein
VRVTGVRIVETTTVGTDVVVVRNRVAVATLLPQEAIAFVWLEGRRRVAIGSIWPYGYDFSNVVTAEAGARIQKQ